MTWETIERKALRWTLEARVTISCASVGRTPHLQVMIALRDPPEWMVGRKPVTLSVGHGDHAGMLRIVPGGVPGRHLVTVNMPSPGKRHVPSTQLRIGAWGEIQAHVAEECRFTASETEVVIWLPVWAGGAVGAPGPITYEVRAPKQMRDPVRANGHHSPSTPSTPSAPSAPSAPSTPSAPSAEAPGQVEPVTPPIAAPAPPAPPSVVPETEQPRPSGDWLTRERREEATRRIKAGEYPPLYCRALAAMAGPAMPDDRKVATRLRGLGIVWTPAPKPPTLRPTLGPDRLTPALQVPREPIDVTVPIVTDLETIRIKAATWGVEVFSARDLVEVNATAQRIGHRPFQLEHPKVRA